MFGRRSIAMGIGKAYGNGNRNGSTTAMRPWHTRDGGNVTSVPYLAKHAKWPLGTSLGLAHTPISTLPCGLYIREYFLSHQ